MSASSNLEAYHALSKEQLVELAQLYGRLALTIDGLWFLGVEGLHTTEKAIELDEEVWRQYGKREGKLLKRFLSINVAGTLEEICRVYLLTPIFANLGGRAEIRNEKCYLSVTDCHPQKARIRKDLGEFPCKGVGIAYLEGFLGELNPKIRFQCVVCPPDAHPEELWCEWEVWIENNE